MRRRPSARPALVALASVLAIALPLAACGGATDGGLTGNDDGGPPPADASRDSTATLGDGDFPCPGTPTRCPDTCDEGTTPAVCMYGRWICLPTGGACAADAAVTDAQVVHHDGGTMNDAGGADAGFACGSMTCDGTTQYCSVVGGGAIPPDGGSNISYTCQPLPAACGGAPSCACVQTHGCPCHETNGDVTVECLYP